MLAMHVALAQLLRMYPNWTRRNAISGAHQKMAWYLSEECLLGIGHDMSCPKLDCRCVCHADD